MIIFDFVFMYLNLNYYRLAQIFDFKEMAIKGTEKFVFSEFMNHVVMCIANGSTLMRIKWFKSVQELFQQVM